MRSLICFWRNLGLRVSFESVMSESFDRFDNLWVVDDDSEDSSDMGLLGGVRELTDVFGL